jgi:hypothetical protein
LGVAATRRLIASSQSIVFFVVRSGAFTTISSFPVSLCAGRLAKLGSGLFENSRRMRLSEHPDEFGAAIVGKLSVGRTPKGWWQREQQEQDAGQVRADYVHVRSSFTSAAMFAAQIPNGRQTE